MELSDYFGNYSQFYYYLSSYKAVKEYRKIKNTLICLKGFSSTTPAIYSATLENACTGGGLYLDIDGYGIAIDPEIGFVDSMHQQGIFIHDINRVIVTHNHLDHNNDLAIISSLQYTIKEHLGRARADAGTTVLIYFSCVSAQLLKDASIKDEIKPKLTRCATYIINNTYFA